MPHRGIAGWLLAARFGDRQVRASPIQAKTLLYLIAYGIAPSSPRQAEAIRDRLDSLGAIQLLESAWLHEFSGDLNTLRVNIFGMRDADDRVVIVPIERGHNYLVHRPFAAGKAQRILQAPAPMPPE